MGSQVPSYLSASGIHRISISLVLFHFHVFRFRVLLACRLFTSGQLRHVCTGSVDRLFSSVAMRLFLFAFATVPWIVLRLVCDPADH